MSVHMQRELERLKKLFLGVSTLAEENLRDSVKAALDRDYPIVFATLYIFTLVGLVVGLVSDLMYTWIDPRIDFERRDV